MNPIDDYLNKHANQKQKVILNKIRAIVKQVVPDAEEVISYGVPGFRYKGGRAFTFFASYKDHMSIHPNVSESLASKVAKYKQAKGTIRFTESDPLPDSLVKEIVQDHFKRYLDSKK